MLLLIIVLVIIGAFFFFAGTVGLLRFPDAHSRLHALSKADNLGLGFIVFSLILHDGTFWGSLKLTVIWFLALLASASSCFLIANWTFQNEGQNERMDHRF